MTLVERLQSAWKAYRDPPRPMLGGEIAYADPSRLFPDGFSIPFNPSTLVGTRGYRVFDEMLKDDQVKAALKFKQHAVIATGWCVEAPEGKDETWEPYVFAEKMLEMLEGSVEDAILEMLSALKYGFSITEKVWDYDQDGRIAPIALKTRRPHEFQFELDPFGNVVNLLQMNESRPVEKFIIYVHDGEFANWYGTSDLEAAYRPWWAKKNAYQWMCMLLERLGIPPIFALYNPADYTGQKLNDLKSVILNMQAATAGIIPRSDPEGLEMWSTEIGTGISQVFVPAMQMFNQDISKALLMPGLIGMSTDHQQGSYARAQVHFDVFMLVVEQIRRKVAELINEQVIRPAIDLNFGPQEEYPCFEFQPLTDDVRVDLLTTWGTLTGQKVVTPQVDDEKRIRELLKMPEITPETEAKRQQSEDIASQQEQVALDNAKKQPAPVKKFAVGEAKYSEIGKALDALELRTESALVSALNDCLDSLISLVRRDFDSQTTGMAWIRQLNLKKFGAVQDALTNAVREACEMGSSAIAQDVARVEEHRTQATATPRAAIKHMTDKAIYIAGVLKDTLTKAAQDILIQALKNGEPLADTIAKLAAAWEPYRGDPTALQNDKVLEPYRLKTIVRTNTTDAYNTGRLARMRDPGMKPYVKAVEYSAIIDERTTPLCESLDGLLFKVDDTDLDKLTPPNHFNCRSLLVPIMIGQPVDKEKYATKEQVGKALDQMAPGFGGAP